MQVVIFGTGNVATVLGKCITGAGHEVVQVWGRNPTQAQDLAGLLQSQSVSHFSEIYLEAHVYLLAVSDSAIQLVANALPAVKGIVVHTAGAVSINVLQHTAEHYGVLYPLQSLRKEKANYTDIPLLIDGNTLATVETLKEFAFTLSRHVQQADDAYRLKLHTAAVVVSNFTNHLYSLAADYCQQQQVDFSLLQPLISETANRLQYYAPSQMQTGPAIRNDAATIATHLKLLQGSPHLQKLYELLTKSIQETNNNA